MDPRMQEMLDHHEIRKLIVLYCHGLDRADAALMTDAYHSDSWVDHGPHHCTGSDFVSRMVPSIVAHSDMCSHQLGQSLINVRSGDAGAETYFTAIVGRTGKDGEKSFDFVGGRYIDILQRERGTWKIKKRLCVRDWWFTQKVEADSAAGSQYVIGTRGAGDPSHDVLGLTHSG